MTLQQFITKYNNQPVEVFDKNNKNQCVDLFLAYIRDVLGLGSIIPIGIVNAYDIYNKTTRFTPHATKHKNTPTFVPKRGDVAIWSSKYGPAGHVAIVTEADINRFRAFSQNDPIGSPCVIREYNYNNVLGFLTPNNLPEENMDKLQACLKAHKEAVDAANQKDRMIENLKGELGQCNTLRNQGVSALEIAEKTIKGLEEEVRVYAIEKEEMQKQLQEERDNLSLAQKMFNDKSDEVSKLQKRVTELEGQLAGGKESDKPIPYKKLYDECQVEVGQYQALIDREYVKKAKSKVAQALQRLAVDIESYILR